MKINVLRFALFPLLALSALWLRPSACAQGLVNLGPQTSYLAQYSLDGITITPIPVGNPAHVGTYGALNIQVYSAAVGTAAPFTATTTSLMPAAWTASSTSPLQQIIANAGWTPLTMFALPTAIPGANVEVMVAGWTGTYTDWNSAYMAWQANPQGVLLGWTGEALSGGALEWVNGTGYDDGGVPKPPVALITGASGYNGLVLCPVPEPSTFALAGLGAVMLMLFHRRK